MSKIAEAGFQTAEVLLAQDGNPNFSHARPDSSELAAIGALRLPLNQ